MLIHNPPKYKLYLARILGRRITNEHENVTYYVWRGRWYLWKAKPRKDWY